MRISRILPTCRRDEQGLVTPPQGYKEQRRSLFLRRLKFHGTAVVPNGRATIRIFQLGLQPYWLTDRLHRGDINLVGKHPKFSVGLDSPIYEIYPVEV